MPIRNVRYRTVKRGGKTIRLALSKSTGEVKEATVVKKSTGKATVVRKSTGKAKGTTVVKKATGKAKKATVVKKSTGKATVVKKGLKR